MEINEKKNESTKQKPLDKNRHKSYQTKRKKGYKADTVKSARDTEENACKQERLPDTAVIVYPWCNKAQMSEPSGILNMHW